ncbi:MAG: carnitine 3-dehydrogenase [Paracoccaceae bacterium]|nr:carnitine 3-dehydrogenase [Paracoccaceae bacterium]
MTISKAALIGGGVIGGGWASRLIENGIDVSVHDPDPEAERKLNEVLAGADRAYEKLTHGPRLTKGAVSFCSTIAEAVAGVGLIVESVPERLDIKRKVYAEAEAANATAVIASSTSGIMPTELQAELAHPGRLIVAHPFNPVYLLPLLELVAGEKTDAQHIGWAKEFYASLGMHPLHCRVEIEGFLSDRLQEALWREALWLLKDEVATAEELDAAIAYGPGLRWAQMGTMQTFHLAGGEAGMRGMLAMFGPCLKWPWTKLMDVPDLTDEFVEMVGEQCDTQAGDLTARDLEKIRDDNLVAIMQALKNNDWGAGKTLAAYESAKRIAPPPPDFSGPVRTIDRVVPGDWTDYNGHMTEGRYLTAFSEATDRLMEMIGADADYIETGLSYFTVETHIQHIDEVRAGDAIYAETQVIEGKGKKLRLFHWLRHADGRLLATGEHMLIHVSLESRGACEPTAVVGDKLAEVMALQSKLLVPEAAGRAIGVK